MTKYGYTPVPGSAHLKTRANDANETLATLEDHDPGALFGQEVGGHWLARATVRSRYVAVLEDVYDRLALAQDAMEQCVYGHLYRLAYGAEQNFCRVSRRELSTRTQLSDRRLGKALAGLVDKKHVALVQRDRRGTLYRVFLPHEVFAEPDHDAVITVRRRRTAPAPKPPAPKPPAPDKRAPGPVADTPQKKQGTKNVDLTLGALVRAAVDEHGESPGRSRAEVLEAVLDRLEGGVPLAQVQRDLARFYRLAPRRVPIAELARYAAKPA